MKIDPEKSDDREKLNSVKGKLFIHAYNVHQGGGKSLLSALLGAFPAPQRTVALLDQRMILPSSASPKLTFRRVAPSVWQRLRAEWWLARNVDTQDTVLCFGNLPPLFKLKGRVYVFVQNRFLVDPVAIGKFHFRARLRLALERIWFSWRSSNADEFLVQTPSMRAALLSRKHVTAQPVHIMPFANLPPSLRTARPVQAMGRHYDFVYIASGEPHKNHRCLIEAWCHLAEQGLFPSLCLTLDRNSCAELCAWIDWHKSRYGLQVENVGNIQQEQVAQLYAQSSALIYPSLFESFGLPLIEASQAGLPVLASELDYVRDLLDPIQTFNPNSPISIANAAKRFLNIKREVLPILDAAQFIAKIAERTD